MTRRDDAIALMKMLEQSGVGSAAAVNDVKRARIRAAYEGATLRPIEHYGQIQPAGRFATLSRALQAQRVITDEAGEQIETQLARFRGHPAEDPMRAVHAGNDFIQPNER